MKILIPTCKAGIWTIYIVYRNKQLGFHIASKVYQFMYTKSHYSSSARSWRCKQFFYAECHVTSWNSATSHETKIRNFKTCLSFLPHRLKLNAASDICSQLHHLLTFLNVWKIVAT